ncbi:MULTISPECIES: hypothetical protein [Pantoea]|uniref:hypothetical protein n=1 Tax=Pantoea TaxID=53335 RepID=UPI001FC8FBF2|nr:MULTISPECIES: hypothetical protein [Pantoea]MCW0976988.1 hypothetical protein [Pantoea sp. JV6]
MSGWLVSYQEEVGSTSHEYHMLLSGQDFTLAEAACEKMGENWWPPERPVCSQGCYWQFDRGCVWLKSIVLLDEREAETLTATPLRLFVPRDAAVRLSLTALPIVLLSDNS